MTEFVGLGVYTITVWAALTLFDELQQRRRVAAWQDRARRLKAMRGAP